MIFSLTTLGYLLGSIPFGFLLSYFFNKTDPRINGSNNIGATNIARLNGWKLGLTTLILDVLKAFIPIKILLYYSPSLLSLFSVAIFFGHIFPIWLKFKGGKGIAVFIGILLAISYLHGIIFLATWLFIALNFKYSSLSALIASIVVLIFSFNYDPDSITNLIFALNIIIFLKHKDNIIRLINKKESKINIKSK